MSGGPAQTAADLRLPSAPHAGWKHLRTNLEEVLPTQLHKANVLRNAALRTLRQQRRRR